MPKHTRSKVSTPKPGTPVRGSRTGRPMMALLDLLGRRWALRILWELSQEPAGFRALQARCDGMSPSVLTQRLGDLQAAGAVTRLATGDYALSDEGEALVQLLLPLSTWAARWAERGQAPADRETGRT